MTILEEASELINGDRAATYGNPKDQYGHLANMLNSFLGTEMDWLDAINVMIIVKLNRVRSGKPFHRDTYVDIAGYAAIAEKAAQSHAPVSDDFWAGVDAGIVEAQEKQERDRTQKPPRVWTSLNDVPLDVRVTDKDGDPWRYFRPETGWGVWQVQAGRGWSEGCELGSECLDDQDEYGPFTEVLDTEQKGSK